MNGFLIIMMVFGLFMMCVIIATGLWERSRRCPKKVRNDFKRHRL